MSNASYKLIVLVLAIVVAAALIAGIAALSERTGRGTDESSLLPAEGTQYMLIPSAMPERIRLIPPAGFTETSSDYYEKYYIKDDASVIVTGEPLTIYGMDAEHYSQSVLEQYKSTVEGFELLNQEDIIVSDAACKLMEFQYSITGVDQERKMQCLTAITVKDDYVYIITCKSNVNTYLSYREEFRHTIESINILPPPATTAPTETLPALNAAPAENAAADPFAAG